MLPPTDVNILVQSKPDQTQLTAGLVNLAHSDQTHIVPIVWLNGGHREKKGKELV